MHLFINEYTPITVHTERYASAPCWPRSVRIRGHVRSYNLAGYLRGRTKPRHRSRSVRSWPRSIPGAPSQYLPHHRQTSDSAYKADQRQSFSRTMSTDAPSLLLSLLRFLSASQPLRITRWSSGRGTIAALRIRCFSSALAYRCVMPHQTVG